MTDFQGKKAVVGRDGVQAVGLTEADLAQREADHQDWLAKKDLPPSRTIADDIADLKAENAALRKKYDMPLTEQEIEAEKAR